MAVAEASAVAPELFREARRASPQRHNNGARANGGFALAAAQKVFPGSPTGPTPASKRRERAFGQPDGEAQHPPYELYQGSLYEALEEAL